MYAPKFRSWMTYEERMDEQIAAFKEAESKRIHSAFEALGHIFQAELKALENEILPSPSVAGRDRDLLVRSLQSAFAGNFALADQQARLNAFSGYETLPQSAFESFGGLGNIFFRG